MLNKLKVINDILEETKAKNIKIYDFEKKSPFFDYVFVATTNGRQASAIAGYLKKADLLDTNRVEGKNTGWTLIDIGDIIIHLFDEQERKNYNFDERLLGIKRIEL